MDSSEIGVVIGGMLLIGFLLWYFFGEQARCPTTVKDNSVPNSDS